MPVHFSSNNTRLPVPKPSSFLEGRVGLSDVDRVRAEIFDAMMDGRLKPGAKLTEASLCTIFRCSRASVRGALALLAHDRLVVLRPNRGAFVWQPSPKETCDVFAARQDLEGLVLDRLLHLPNLAQVLAPMRNLVKCEQQAFETGDRISWLRLSHAFHVKLAQLTGNEVLVEMMHSLCARSTLIMACYDNSGGGGHTCSYGEHGQILDLLQNGDRQAVRTAMCHHLQDCEDRLLVSEVPPVIDPWAAFSVQPQPTSVFSHSSEPIQQEVTHAA